MTWIVEHANGDVSQHEAMPGSAGIDIGVRHAMIPRLLDLSTERWDWEAGAITARITPEEAAAEMWERAKVYRDVERFYSEPLAVANVVSDAIVMVERDDRYPRKDRTKVSGLAWAASEALRRGEDLTISFTDGANEHFTVNAEQTVALWAAVVRDDTLCHAASQIVRATIAGALQSGATAEQIFAIDITAGYPPLEP